MNVPLTPIRFLRYAEQQFPTRTAVVCDALRFTYSQLALRARKLAGALQSLGIERGDRVAFLSTNCHRLLEAYYGVLEAGAVLLPLNIRLSAQELAYILNDSGAKVLFLESQFEPLVESFLDSLANLRTFVLQDNKPGRNWLFPHSYDEIVARAAPFACEIMDIEEDSIAELFYTSGTSANPKGVMLTHRNVYLHAVSTSISLGTHQGSVELHTIPLFHANGWGNAHIITFLGAKHVMIHRFDPVQVFRLIESEKVETCALVPAMALALVNSPEREKFDLRSLRRVIIGGAASSPTLVRQLRESLGCTCFSGYGLTETSPVLTISPLKSGLMLDGQDPYERQSRAGYAILGVELRVVAEDGNDVPADGQSVGEVWTRSDGVMTGYWNDAEATAEAMSEGWFHTGDLATVDESGYLLIVDRKKDIIVSGGENISSLEVEKALCAHPCVYEVAVIPVPDAQWGDVPKAIVVLKPGSSTTEQELLKFCRGRLAHYKCPKSVMFVDSLPKTGTGKVMKRELRQKFGSGITASQ
jgi:fatty-acyl-CoA synthase